MLSSFPIKSFIPTSSLSKAKFFYGDTLGLKLLHEDNFAVEFESGGRTIRITLVKKLKAQSFTILGWDVAAIKDITVSMMKKGIKFERYRILEQDELGIWTSPNGTKVAWFKDPDGNL